MQTTSENTADILKLLELLRSVPVGGKVLFEQMDSAIGRSIQPRRYLLFSAMKKLNAETGAVFESVRGVGYKRLDIESTPSVAVRNRRRIRRVAKQTMTTLANVQAKANDVPPHIALLFNQEQAIAGTIRALARDGMKGKAAKDSSETAPAPVAKVATSFLEALK